MKKLDPARPAGLDSTFHLDGGAESVPLARRFVAATLAEAGLDDLLPDAAVITTELCSNAVLHASESPATLRLSVVPGPRLRVEVQDSNPMPPVPMRASAGGTTGRGLSLVSRLSEKWGVDRRPDGADGKVVWAEQCSPATAEAETEFGLDLDPDDFDLDSLLAEWPDLEAAPEEADSIVLTDLPVTLFLESDQHVESLLRELRLAAAESGRTAHRLRPGLVNELSAGLRLRETARRALLRAAMDAAARGEDRFSVRLPVLAAPESQRASVPDLLAEAEQYARDERLLTLETPTQYRVFRRWLDQHARAKTVEHFQGVGKAEDLGERGVPPRDGSLTFEEFLLAELTSTEDRLRSSALAATLQEVTAELADTQSAAQIAHIAVRHGCETLRAAGGLLIVIDADLGVRFLGGYGIDVGLPDRFRQLGDSEHGPARVASLTGQPVFLESPQERDERFPRLGETQPEAEALAVVPLAVAGEPVGVLRFSFDRPHLFGQDERAYLLGLAGQAALAFARVRIIADLERAWEQLAGQQTANAQMPVTRTLPDEAGLALTAVDLALLRTLYRDAPIGIAVYDAAGRYLRLNMTLAATHHGTWSEQIGMTVEQALGPVEGRVLRERVEEVFRTGKPLLNEDFWLVDVRGVRRCWRTHWFPIRDVAERVDAVLAVATDITAPPFPR